VEAFRASGRNFLMPPAPEALSRDTKLDISHEALIRQWSRLSGTLGADGRREKGWVELEADSADFYRYLLRAARNRRDKGGELWSGIDLDNALAWRDAHHPNAHWAARYGGDFGLADAFIDDSVR